MLFKQSDGSWQVYLSVPSPSQWFNLGNYASREVAELVHRVAQKVESCVKKGGA
jgi:hypothetical protein